MGRRKIEIQPITRKNGLFKKAYELGVLCSVDVAVIIFEERPGHHVKLYQYGSSDIHDIVQRHLRHDGEKDTRGPADFSGNNSNKLDDIGDEDDGEDDDEDLPSRKRRQDGKLKSADMATGNVDYTSPGHRNLSIPQPPPLSLHGIGSQSGGGGRPTLPLSDSRSMDMRDGKRSSHRLGLHPGHSRSPSDDINPGNGNYPYYPGQNSGTFNRQPQYGGHHSSHHSQGGPGHHSSAPYQPFFPVSGTHSSPPPSFIPLQSEFSRGPSSRGGGSGPGFGLGGSRSDSMPYPGMLRTQNSGSSQSTGPGGGSGGGNNDLFAAFLDADEQSRHQSHSNQGGSLVGLDWPVHNTSGSGPGGGGGGGSSAPSGPSSSVSNPSGPTPSLIPDGPHDANWLDFLSGNNNNNNNNNNNSNPPSSGREAMSWERGGGGVGVGGGGGGGGGGSHHHRGSIPDIFGSSERGRAGVGSGGSMVVGISGKRTNIDEDPSIFSGRGGMLASPASLNERLSGDFKKEILKDGS